MQCESSPKFAHYIRALKTPKFLHKPSSILTKIAFSTNRPSMAPTWRRSSTTDDSARDVARQAAIRRRDIYMAIRSHLATLYPTYPSLVVRSQQSAGAEGQFYYVALVLYESSQSSRRLSASNPVISRDEQYYDDRLVVSADLARYTVLLNGTPGLDQTEGMARLLERCEVLVRSGWRSSGPE